MSKCLVDNNLATIEGPKASQRYRVQTIDHFSKAHTQAEVYVNGTCRNSRGLISSTEWENTLCQ